MSSLFSRRLREFTATGHDDVEHRGFIVGLMDGSLNRRAYAMLLNQYALIHARLERRMRDFADHPVLAPFVDSRLDRHARTVSDLIMIGEMGLPVVSATADYLHRLDAISTPEELLAHHYTRYLGDLSGGQAIGARMAEHYGLGTDELTIWDYSALGGIAAYKDSYRAKLDGVSGCGGDEFIVSFEAGTAFELNSEILTQLGVLVAAHLAPAPEWSGTRLVEVA